MRRGMNEEKSRVIADLWDAAKVVGEDLDKMYTGSLMRPSSLIVIILTALLLYKRFSRRIDATLWEKDGGS